MSLVLPRLARSAALELIERYRSTPLDEIAAAMPDTNAVTTYSPVGGQRVDVSELASLRSGLLAIARDHGMPGPMVATSDWEARSARFVHEKLRITPHEASTEEVWSYLTCCWLFDVAVWRFPGDASIERFIGHLNRNTFRRMWWRAEVFGPSVDLELLGEDELVNIMERPTLFSDRSLARAIAAEHIARVARGDAQERMRLMREATKRILRLTPFVAFEALDATQLGLYVADAFDAAAAGLAGRQTLMPHRSSNSIPTTSADVHRIDRMEITAPTDGLAEDLVESAREVDFEQVAAAALGIARRTGRVTNIALREVVPAISAEEARDVFRVLMERGALVRRGVKRGTHYVIPEEASALDEAPIMPAPAAGEARPAGPPRDPAPSSRSTETALRRLLRRPR
jgi:hypothetical protein